MTVNKLYYLNYRSTSITNQRNQYSREFKLEAIEMVIEHKRKIPDVATELGIGKSTLQKWLSQYRKEQQGITPTGSKALTE